MPASVCTSNTGQLVHVVLVSDFMLRITLFWLHISTPQKVAGQGQIYILFRAPGRPSEWKTRRQNGNSRQNLARMVPGLES